MRPVIPLLSLLALAACATTDPGWTGSGAEPFEGAEAACRAEVAALDGDAREAAFEACMAARGWHR